MLPMTRQGAKRDLPAKDATVLMLHELERRMGMTVLG